VPVKKLTPVLFVERIELVLPFWTEHLGFIKTVEVPEGDRLGFVILQQGSVEVMYQSYASADKDVPAVAAAETGVALRRRVLARTAHLLRRARNRRARSCRPLSNFFANVRSRTKRLKFSPEEYTS
jgi:hypothetical protein